MLLRLTVYNIILLAIALEWDILQSHMSVLDICSHRILLSQEWDKKQTKQWLDIHNKEVCWNVWIFLSGFSWRDVKLPAAWAGETKTWQHQVTQTDDSHPECNLSRRTLGLLLISDARPTAWFFHQEALSMPNRKWDTCCEVCRGKSQIRKLTLYNTNECLRTHMHTHTQACGNTILRRWWRFVL